MQSSMKNITVLDTNVILRYVLKDHTEHFKIAQRFMSTVKNGDQTVYIPDSVLAECIYVLLKVYKIPKNEACETLSLLLNYAGISQDNKGILLSALALFAQHNVDIVDAIVYATSKQQGWELFSFDKDMTKFN